MVTNYRERAEEILGSTACPAEVGRVPVTEPRTDKHFLLVNAKTMEVLPVPSVTSSFRPVQPVQVLEALLPHLPAFTKKVDNPSTATTRLLFGESSRAVSGQDTVEQSFSLDMGPVGSVSLGQWGWRLVCRNGMVRLRKVYSAKVVHRGNIAKQIMVLASQLAALRVRGEQEFQLWQRQANTPLTPELWVQLLDHAFPITEAPVYGPNAEQNEAKHEDWERKNGANMVRREAAHWRLQDEAADLGVGTTLWLAMNAVTHTIQYPPAGSRSPRTNQETRLHFGSMGRASASVESFAMTLVN